MERTPHRDRQGRSEAPVPSLPPALLVGSPALPQWGGGLLYHLSGCPGPPASLCRCHTPPHFFEGAHSLAPPTPGCHQEPGCSPGSGHRSRPTANNTHSVRWPGACELEPVLQRTQNPAAGASVLWVTSRRLSWLPHWWACAGTFGRRSKKRPGAVCSRSFGPLFLVIRFGDLRSHVLGSGHRHPFLGTLEGFEHEERVAGWVPVSPRAARGGGWGGGRGGGAAGPVRARRGGRGGEDSPVEGQGTGHCFGPKSGVRCVSGVRQRLGPVSEL